MIAIAGTSPVPSRPRVAYVVSRYPKLTETFIAREMHEVAERGVDVRLYSLARDGGRVVQPQAKRFLSRAHFASRAPAAVVAAQLHWLRRRPASYLTVGAWITARHVRHPRLLVRAAVAFAAGAWFARLAEQDRISHVHAHWATYPALAALVMKRLTGIPFSVTVHAHDLYVAQPMLTEKLAEATTIVTISEYNRRLLRILLAAGDAARVRVVHCGVDTGTFVPPARHVDGAGEIRLACVAALEAYKGHAVLLAACGHLLDAGLNVRCTLVGEGPERHRLEGMVAALGLGGVVSFAGAVDEAGVLAAFAVADIVVQPSLVTVTGKTEGIPNALMEAMAMELPVIASDVTGMRELVIDGVTGLVVPPGDAGGLAQAIADLAKAPTRRRAMGAAGRRRVITRFTLRATGDAMADVVAHHATVSGGT